MINHTISGFIADLRISLRLSVTESSFSGLGDSLDTSGNSYSSSVDLMFIPIKIDLN